MSISWLRVACILGLVGCTTVTLLKDDPHYLVKTNNTHKVLLSKYDNYLVRYEFSDGDLVGYTAEYFYTDDGVDYKLLDSNSNVVATSNVREGATYTVNEEGNKLMLIYLESTLEDKLATIGFCDFATQTIEGDFTPVENGLSISTVKNNDNSTSTFTYIADNETHLFQSATFKTVNLEGEVTNGATVTFEYDSEYTPDLSAYNAIVGEGDEVLNFSVVINPTTNTEEKTFVITDDVIVAIDSTDEQYTLYKNFDCMKDIEDLTEYLEYYDGAKIYACPTKEQFSFALTLSQADIDHMNYLIETFIDLGKTTKFFEEAEDARIMMEDRMGYFVHQYYVGQIEYYMDITNEKNQDAFNFAQNTYYEMYNAYIDAYKQVYETKNDYSEWLFADWTEEDLAILYADNEAITECESINSQLEQEFNELKQSSATWAKDVSNIYERLVANNQKLAKLNGYDNAYEYYSDSVFDRVYTAEERSNLITFIKQYIVPYRAKAENFYSSCVAKLSPNIINNYRAIMFENLKSVDSPYLGGYIKSFDNSLKDKMLSLFEKNLAKFAISYTSMGTAFANYSGYYEEGFTFFGTSYQDILTIVHEMGHYISFDSYSLSDMGYDLAETHSQAHEWMFLNFLHGKISQDKLGKPTYDIILSTRLYNGMETIIRGMLVDEFEYRVYTAETPYTADEYAGVMMEILTEFGFSENDFENYYTNYAQIVTILSPVYYLNYVTSELASIEFYLIAEDQGYEVAQEVYRKLQEDVDVTMPYAEILENIGLSGPFKEETYQLLGEVFFTEN